MLRFVVVLAVVRVVAVECKLTRWLEREMEEVGEVEEVEEGRR